MGEPARPEAGPRQAAVSAAVFGLLLFLWVGCFLVELGELAHNAETMSFRPRLNHTWAYYGNPVRLAGHWAVLGALACYALWQRTGSFGAALSRVLGYCYLAAFVLLMSQLYCWYVDPQGHYLDDPHRAVHLITLSALGCSLFGVILYSLTRSSVGVWLSLLMPLCHMLVAVTFFGWGLVEEHDLAGGVVSYYPTWPVVIGHMASVAVLAVVLAATSKACRIPPGALSALLLAGLAGLAIMHAVLWQLIYVYHLLIESLEWGQEPRWAAIFIPADALFIYLIWRHRRREGAAGGPP